MGPIRRYGLVFERRRHQCSVEAALAAAPSLSLRRHRDAASGSAARWRLPRKGAVGALFDTSNAEEKAIAPPEVSGLNSPNTAASKSETAGGSPTQQPPQVLPAAVHRQILGQCAVEWLASTQCAAPPGGWPDRLSVNDSGDSPKPWVEANSLHCWQLRDQSFPDACRYGLRDQVRRLARTRSPGHPNVATRLERRAPCSGQRSGLRGG